MSVAPLSLASFFCFSPFNMKEAERIVSSAFSWAMDVIFFFERETIFFFFRYSLRVVYQRRGFFFGDDEDASRGAMPSTMLSCSISLLFGTPGFRSCGFTP